MKYYFSYVFKSLKDNKLYIGWTTNLKDRLNKHNSDKIQSTKSRKPFELIYFEGRLDKKKAISREKQLKTGFGRKYLKRV